VEPAPAFRKRINATFTPSHQSVKTGYILCRTAGRREKEKAIREARAALPVPMEAFARSDAAIVN
jgi:hypothetical protein